jgi:hypothetical protein
MRKAWCASRTTPSMKVTVFIFARSLSGSRRVRGSALLPPHQSGPHGAHILLEELAEAVIDGTRKEYVDLS